MNIVVTVPAPRARRIAARAEGAESLGHVLDHAGQTAHDFSRQGEVASLKALAREMAGGAPPDDFEGAYVEGIPDVEWGPRATFAMSANFSIVTVIDRAFALPHGVPFLLGHGYRRFRPKAKRRAARGWQRLLAAMGGAAALAKRVVPYVDRGGAPFADVLTLVRALSRAFDEDDASASDRDLLVLGCLASERL